MEQCVVPGCAKAVRSRHLCAMHYDRNQRPERYIEARVALCGHRVAPHPGRQRKLCDECAALVPSRPEVVSCIGCGATVGVASTGKVPKYCSARCRTWVNNHPGERTPPLGECGHCGKALDRTGKKYCSTKCSQIARGERLPEPLSKRRCALPECGAEFQPKSRYQRCCCERHGKILCNRELRATGRMPPGDPEKRRRNLRAKTQRRRAAIRGGRRVERFSDLEIFERDGWRCGICRKRVDKRLRWPHPKSPSLDHIVPLSEDPNGHTRANVRCAHLECNVRRSNRGGGEQLLLVG